MDGLEIDIPENDLTIPEKLIALKDKLQRHRRVKGQNEKLHYMQGSVEKLLKRAFHVGERHKKNEKLQGKERVDHLINRIRRGWKSHDDAEGIADDRSTGADGYSGITQINKNSPEINDY